jgi:hypothetical protein
MKFSKAYEKRLRLAYDHLDSAYCTLEEVAQDMLDTSTFLSPTLTQEDVESAAQEMEDIRDATEQARDNLEILAALSSAERS